MANNAVHCLSMSNAKHTEQRFETEGIVMIRKRGNKKTINYHLIRLRNRESETYEAQIYRVVGYHTSVGCGASVRVSD